MPDVFTKEKRSYIMSRIRSKWTKPEKTIHGYLKGRKIAHKMHPRIPGSPDLILTDAKRAVFIHGCFWHGCPKCSKKAPRTNPNFWKQKIERNMSRDREAVKKLKSDGWKVVIVWEHSMKDVQRALDSIVG